MRPLILIRRRRSDIDSRLVGARRYIKGYTVKRTDDRSVARVVAIICVIDRLVSAVGIRRIAKILCFQIGWNETDDDVVIVAPRGRLTLCSIKYGRRIWRRRIGPADVIRTQTRGRAVACGCHPQCLEVFPYVDVVRSSSHTG